jgi:hypothetical protein
MNACKYSIGQKVQIGIYEGEGDARRLVVRDATVVKTESRYHGNNSNIFLRVAHDDCFEDMRVWTTTLTRLIKNASKAAANA